MRFKQFQIDERQKAREMYPHLTEEQLDEVLPALVAGARTVGMGAIKGAKMIGQGARAGVNAVKTGANVVKKGVNAVKNTVQMGKDAVNKLKGGSQGGIDNGQAVDDVAMKIQKLCNSKRKLYKHN